MKTRRSIPFHLIVICLAVAPVAAFAQSPYTWDLATGTEGSWNVEDNWSGTGIPAANEVANFTTSGSVATITLDGNQNIGNATFSNVNSTWNLNEGTVAGSKLSLSDGDTTAGEGGLAITVNDTIVNWNVDTGSIAASGTNASDTVTFLGSGGTVNFTKLSHTGTGGVASYLAASSTLGSTPMTYNLDTVDIIKRDFHVGILGNLTSINAPNAFASTHARINQNQTITVQSAVLGGDLATSVEGLMTIRNGATWAQNGSSMLIGYSGSDGNFRRSRGRVVMGETPGLAGNLTIGANVGLSIGNRGGTGILDVNNGTLTVDASGDFQTTLEIGGASKNGGSTIAGGGNGTINLSTGGTIVTARAFFTNFATASAAAVPYVANGTGTFNFDGGLLRINRATGYVTTDLFENNITVNVLDGGARIDTQGFNSAFNEPLTGAGSGGLEKLGSGTLTLTGTSTYTGDTTIIDGTLSVASPNFDDDSSLTIGTTVGSAAVLNLPNSGTDNVAALVIDGVTMPVDLYDSSNSDGAITGDGKIQVGSASANDFAAWASSQVPPVTGGPNGDFDNDGIANLVEYALADGQERGSLTGTTLSFTKRGAPWGGDITCTIETSEDLGISDPWETATPDVNDASTISYTLQNPGDNFARLKVSQN